MNEPRRREVLNESGGGETRLTIRPREIAHNCGYYLQTICGALLANPVAGRALVIRKLVLPLCGQRQASAREKTNQWCYNAAHRPSGPGLSPPFWNCS